MTVQQHFLAEDTKGKTVITLQLVKYCIYIFSFSLPPSCLSITCYYALLCQCTIGWTRKATHERFSCIKRICLKNKLLTGFTGLLKGVKHTWIWQVAVWWSIRSHKV